MTDVKVEEHAAAAAAAAAAADDDDDDDGQDNPRDKLSKVDIEQDKT